MLWRGGDSIRTVPRAAVDELPPRWKQEGLIQSEVCIAHDLREAAKLVGCPDVKKAPENPQRSALQGDFTARDYYKTEDGEKIPHRCVDGHLERFKLVLRWRH